VKNQRVELDAKGWNLRKRWVDGLVTVQLPDAWYHARSIWENGMILGASTSFAE
jgi:hypothetical protein